MEYESQNTIYFINEKYGLKVIKRNNKFGVLDHENKILIPPIYSHIWFRIDGYLLVSLNGKMTLFTTYGVQLLPFKYDNISSSNHGLMCVSSNGKWGILNSQFQEIVPTIYDHCIITEGYMTPILVKRNNKWGLVSSETGELISPPIYDNIGNTGVYDLFEFPELPADDIRLKTPFFNFGLASVQINGKWGFIDTKGEIKIPPVWDSVSELGFYGGVAQVYLFDKKLFSCKIYEIDTSGKIICELIRLDDIYR